MAFPLELAFRYMRSKQRAFVSVGTMLAVVGVMLGTAALATVMSVTGGFRAEFREKVLGVNAHVLVLKYSSDFREYREIMEQMEDVPGVVGVAPFVINPMMVTHGERTATGVLLKGVDPDRMDQVLDLPRHLRSCGENCSEVVQELRLPDAKPPERRSTLFDTKPKKKRKKKAPLSPGGLGNPDAPILDSADAGAPDGEDTRERLHEAVRKAIDRPDAGAPIDAGTDADDSEWEEFDLPEDAPSGSIEPDGGYQEWDDLDDSDSEVEEALPDPCKEKDAAKRVPGIIVGATLKENLAVDLGDCVTVTSPTIGYSVTRGSLRPPVAKQFRVIAIFEAGFDQYDSKLVYTDLYESQDFFDYGDSVTGVEMKVNDIGKAGDISDEIDKMLANGIYNTMDWEELNHGLFTALRIQQLMMSLVLALIILVAAFTLIATLIMVVLDKKKEIAVLKAMGATDWALLRAFLYQGALVGVVGTVLGLGLGYAVCKGLLIYGFPLDPKVYFISKLPVQVRLSEFALTGAFAILVCVSATIWPALYAARLRPAEAFREQ